MTFAQDRGARTDIRQRRNVQAARFPFQPTEVKTAAYRAAYYDLVLSNPTGGGFTVTLPEAKARPGAWLTVKNVTASTNTITVAASGSETIDGSATAAMSTARQAVTFISDGSGWVIV